MKLTPWRKHSEMGLDFPSMASPRYFRDQMDRLFDSFFGSSPFGESAMTGGAAGVWVPDLEISDTDKEIVVRAEVPGLRPEDIDIRLTGNVLTISGEKKEETEENKGGYIRSERRYGVFSRAVQLPPNVKEDSVTADYDKGVLTLKIGKQEGSGSRKIQVQASTQKQGEKQPEKPAQQPPPSGGSTAEPNQ